MNWKSRFSTMKKALGLSYQEIADLVGYTKDSVKSSANKADDDFPRGLMLAVTVFEKTTKLLSPPPENTHNIIADLYMKGTALYIPGSGWTLADNATEFAYYPGEAAAKQDLKDAIKAAKKEGMLYNSISVKHSYSDYDLVVQA